MRRFELIEGNSARFFEIERHHDLVITRQGIIGRKPKEREKELADDMAAEVEFDRQIHAKRGEGWVEVDEPSDPLQDFDERALELRPLDGSKAMTFSGPAMKYLLRRMVDVLMFDRHREATDLSRWEERATRRSDLDEMPSPGDAAYDAWHQEFLRISHRDRAARMENDLVGAFKFREGSHWIVTPAECAFIASEGANRRPKRKKDTAEQAKWVQDWCAFHERVKDAGYEVVPA